MTFRSQLDEAGVDYEIESPEQAYTDRERFVHEPRNDGGIVKPLIFTVGDDALMLLVPAPAEIDRQKLRAEFGPDIQPAGDDVSDSLLGTEPGAQAPDGSRYGMPTYIDASLLDRERVICRDGRARIRLSTTDFVRMVEPEVVEVVDDRRPVPH